MSLGVCKCEYHNEYQGVERVICYHRDTLRIIKVSELPPATLTPISHNECILNMSNA